MRCRSMRLKTHMVYDERGIIIAKIEFAWERQGQGVRDVCPSGVNFLPYTVVCRILAKYQCDFRLNSSRTTHVLALGIFAWNPEVGGKAPDRWIHKANLQPSEGSCKEGGVTAFGQPGAGFGVKKYLGCCCHVTGGSCHGPDGVDAL